MTAEARRLHALSWLFIATSSVKGLIVPAVFVMVASGGAMAAAYEVWLLVFIVPAVIAGVVKQAVYSYRFAADELVVRDGVLTREERHIPYDRVHNIAVVRNPFHRMFGVASALVETAGGGKPEAVLRVLSLEAVEELRARTLGRKVMSGIAASANDPSEGDASEGDKEAGEDTDPAVADGWPRSPGTPLLQLPLGDLVRMGLISNRGFVVVAAAMGLLSQTDWWELDWDRYYERVPEGPATWLRWLIEPGSLPARVLLGAGLLVLFVGLLRVFSVAWHLVKYHGFTLSREGEDDLRTEYGLFTQVSTIIPGHRIQLLTVRATLLHRWLQRAEVDLETAGASESGSDFSDQLAASGVKKRRQWLAPLIQADRAAALLHEVLPEIDLEEVDWKPLATRARRRILRRSYIVLALISVAALAILTLTPIPLSGLHALWLPAIGGPLIFVWATGWVRIAGYALTDRAVFFRSGWPGRKVSVVRLDKVQTVRMKESPFDRRARMATVAVDTAGAATMGHRIDIPYIELEVAKELARRLYGAATTTEYRW